MGKYIKIGVGGSIMNRDAGAKYYGDNIRKSRNRRTNKRTEKRKRKGGSKRERKEEDRKRSKTERERRWRQRKGIKLFIR